MCGRLAGRYVTAAYLFIDARARVIRYAAAGHPPMLHAPSRQAPVRRIERNGLLLGFVEDASYDDVELPLGDADRFLLYTDGVIEAANAADDLFGVERLEGALASASSARSSLSRRIACLVTTQGFSGCSLSSFSSSCRAIRGWLFSCSRETFSISPYNAWQQNLIFLSMPHGHG